MKLVTVGPLVLAVLGCTTTPSRLDHAAQAAEAPPPAVLDRDDRLARVERRLDKVIATLDQALGPAEPDPAATYAVPIDVQDPIEGPRDAKVTIVEGYEFLCPYCYLVNPLVEQIRAKYPNDVRVVSKYLVIHGAPAVTAGTYACAAAKQGKFTEMKTALWNRLWKTENGRPEAQPDEASHLDTVAASLGLDHDRLARGGWLADEAEVAAWFHGHADVHFCGHVHEATIVQTKVGNGRSSIAVIGSASHGEAVADWKQAMHGYSVGALKRHATGTVEVEIWPRVWAPERARFMLDAGNVMDGTQSWTHELARADEKEPIIASRSAGLPAYLDGLLSLLEQPLPWFRDAQKEVSLSHVYVQP